MGKKFAIFTLLFLVLALLTIIFLNSSNIAVLNPKGLVAIKERDLIITSALLMLIVVIPVFIMTFAFAWKYRASNTKAKYTPDWDHHLAAEFLWWALPCVIIIVLAVVAWRSAHDLDPFKPLESSKKPITIQVVALQWKWLFIYPEQNIATVNLVQFPEQTPVNFEITSDAPMNSFWIPQLGGQVYAMSGMSTKLHLEADLQGSFNGSSANISGRGFAGMKFTAKAVSQADFMEWVHLVKKVPIKLSLDEYNKLAIPSENNPVAYYSSEEQNLYDRVVMKFMTPAHRIQNTDMQSMSK
jgi:cytochrome o ubiquinol oxidase subunit 2